MKSSILSRSLDEESFHVENTSFANAHMSSVLNATASNVDHFNASGVDDLSFTMRGGSRQSFDMNVSHLMASDQSMVLMLKEAFQCYLKKDEVKGSQPMATCLQQSFLKRRNCLLVQAQ